MTEQDLGARFRVGHATAREWREAVSAALVQLEPLPAGANIGFAYFTDHYADHAGDILARLKARTKIDAWIGTTGIGACASGVEYYDRPAIALMAGSMPAGAFALFDRLDRRTSGWFGIVHADPRVPALPETLADLGEASGAFLVGGLTVARGAQQPQLAGKLVSGGLSGVMFDDSVAVVTGLSQGCHPIGPAHKITECEGNIIAKLDGQPALDVLRNEVGSGRNADLDLMGGKVVAALPVMGADRPDYLVRNIAGLDPRNGLIAIAALVEPEQALMFCRRDSVAAEADLDRMLSDVKRRVGNRQARGAVYFSCVARGPNMFGPGNRELRRIDEAFGGLPLVGFFCGGEISNARLYGYTGVLSVFV